MIEPIADSLTLGRRQLEVVASTPSDEQNLNAVMARGTAGPQFLELRSTPDSAADAAAR